MRAKWLRVRAWGQSNAEPAAGNLSSLGVQRTAKRASYGTVPCRLSAISERIGFRPRTCEMFWDGGMKVWIGDIMNGHRSETVFSEQNMRMGGQWLVDEAARLFPKAFQ